jgi:hypothetical protein
VLGAVVLVVALVALRHPRSTTTHAGSATRTVTLRSSPSSGTSHSPTAPASKSHASSSRASTSPKTSPKTSSSSSGVAQKLPLVVLNNTTTNGLAAQAKDQFEAGGWTVTSYGNYQNDIISTCAYYDPNVAGAQASAEALRTQFPAIKRVVAKFPELPAGPIVVVLTTDYTS